MLARLFAIVVAATALNGLAGAETRLTGLNVWWATAVVLLAVRVCLGRETQALRLADLVVNVCGMLLLAHLALARPGSFAVTMTPIAELALALAFAAALTSAIVRLGLLLDGRRAIIRLTDA
jgi:hypothetical protein